MLASMLLLFDEYLLHSIRVKRLDVEQVERFHHVERTLLVGLEVRSGQMVLVSVLVAVYLHDTNLCLVGPHLIGEDADDPRLFPDRLGTDIP